MVNEAMFTKSSMRSSGVKRRLVNLKERVGWVAGRPLLCSVLALKAFWDSAQELLSGLRNYLLSRLEYAGESR
jgi:hypothetical protein